MMRITQLKRAGQAVLTIWLLLLFGTLFSQGPLTYLSSTEGGSAYEVLLHNNRLYVGAATTLQIWDLTGPNLTPGNLLSQHRFASNIDQLQVNNGTLYLCANHAGLYKLDVTTDPDTFDILAHFPAPSPDAAIYDIAFKGDSLLVAAKSKLLLLQDQGSITYLSTIDSVSGSGRIRGLDIKGDYLAYTRIFTPNLGERGVILYDLANMQTLDFYHHPTGDPQEVYFGKNNNLLHVMGGQIWFSLHGLYYALDYSNPSSLSLKNSFQINGSPLLASVSSPMSAKLINDTIYVATHGGGNIDTLAFKGKVFVYDATDPDSIYMIDDLYAGLYHFDIDIDPQSRVMYVASEWYGIQSMDINDLHQELFLNRTPTGGWCHGSGLAKDRLVEASEGFGIRLFDISQPESPQLVAEDRAIGFCRSVSISDSADYVYAWYLTGNEFRVFDANNLNTVSSLSFGAALPFFADMLRSQVSGAKVAVIGAGSMTQLIVVDVSNPQAPAIDYSQVIPDLQDLGFHSNGRLFAMGVASLLILDTTSYNVVHQISPPNGSNQEFKAMAWHQDTLLVYHQGNPAGISRYLYEVSLDSLVYLGSSNLGLTSQDRIYLACDDSLIYLAATLDGLQALELYPPHNQLANYTHAGDFLIDNQWGARDLYTAEGLLVLNEYMGQTSLYALPQADTMVAIFLTENHFELFLYPNPGSGYTRLMVPESGNLVIVDLQGRKVLEEEVEAGEMKIDMGKWGRGSYLVSLRTGTGIGTQKLFRQ